MQTRNLYPGRYVSRVERLKAERIAERRATLISRFVSGAFLALLWVGLVIGMGLDR